MRASRVRALAAISGLACLLPGVAGDALDIKAQLYRDDNCFERAQDLTLLDSGCYANLYTNITKAYTMKIVGFGATERFDLFEYIGTCNQGYQYSARPRQIQGGRCTRFLGPFYAILKSTFRSNSCSGSDCSSLNVATQNFFSEAGCAGLPTQSFKYPVQNACLRWSNGTQTYQVDATYSNITQVDYPANDLCAGGFRRTYVITNRRCYSLYPDKAPRSFSWTVEASTSSTGAISAASPRKRALGAPALAVVAPLAVLRARGDL
mmetsp:Transcript_11755/g.32126  ORF Transcript_11755/g.32126 Transcript_11755/m.32126 type:complete len:264 (-) Transcript_11755:177-968(-)